MKISLRKLEEKSRLNRGRHYLNLTVVPLLCYNIYRDGYSPIEVIRLKKDNNNSSKKRRPFREIIDNANIMDYLVFICITSINIFVIVSLYFYYKHDIPISGIQSYFFTFFGTELIAMATISISSNIAEAQKNRRERKKEELDDEL